MWLQSILLIALLFTQTTPQVKVDEKFSKVPVELRGRLIERINLYFLFESTQQYDKLYDLISINALSGSQPTDKPSKEDFIKENQDWDAKGTRLMPVKLKVTKVSKHNVIIDHPVYIIWFEMKARYSGRIVDKEILFLEAHLENGDWYFRSHHIEI